jgi:hypothetical protein
LRPLDEPQYAPDLRQLLSRDEMKAKTHLSFAIDRPGRPCGAVHVDARLTEELQTPEFRTELSRRDLSRFGPSGPVLSGAPTPAN